jgi:hypothetical protein
LSRALSSAVMQISSERHDSDAARTSIEILPIPDNNPGIHWLTYWGLVGDIVGHFLPSLPRNTAVEGLTECRSTPLVLRRRAFDHDISIT